MGQMHFRAYREIAGARVTALFDFDARVFERAPIQGNIGTSDLGDLSGISRFSDVQRFLAEDLDVVDVCVPTYLHREFAESALKSGRAVFCEKPMALTVSDCDAMIAAAARAKKLLMVGQCVRFWP